MKRAKKFVCLSAIILFAIAGCTGLQGTSEPQPSSGPSPLEPNIDGAVGTSVGTVAEGVTGANVGTPVFYNLAVNVEGKGTVSSNAEKLADALNPNIIKGLPEDTVVGLTVLPDVGSEFVEWSGSCSGTGSCGFTMGGEKLVTAIFREALSPIPSGPKTLAITFNGPASAGKVRSTDMRFNCDADCSQTYTPVDLVISSVVLTAKPAPGYAFIGWSGACAGLELCNVSLAEESTAVAANFGVARQLTVDLDPTSMVGSKVSVVAKTFAGVSPEITNTPPYVDEYAKDAVMTLVASPAAGSRFGSWIEGPCATSENPTCTFVLDDNKVVKVSFVKNEISPDVIKDVIKSTAGTDLQVKPIQKTITSTTTGSDIQAKPGIEKQPIVSPK